MKILQWDPETHGWRDDEKIAVSDRGFRYGMAVFETFLIANRHPVLLQDHLTNLFGFGRSLNWPLPSGGLLSLPHHLRGMAGDLPDWAVGRIHLTAGDGAFGSPPAQCRLLLTLQSSAPLPPVDRLRPLHVTARTLAHTQGFPGAFGFKSHNYWHNLQMQNYGKLYGCEEVLLSGNDGSISSFSRGNLFALKGRLLHTPPLDSGARPGAMRAWLKERYRVEEDTPLYLDDLYDADELFLSNSVAGVVPVRSLNGHRFYAGQKSLRLAEKWRDFLKSETSDT